MANKKQITQAEKTATAAKAKKNAANHSKSKKLDSNIGTSNQDNKLPIRLISSFVLLALTVLFAIILFASEGVKEFSLSG